MYAGTGGGVGAAKEVRNQCGTVMSNADGLEVMNIQFTYRDDRKDGDKTGLA